MAQSAISQHIAALSGALPAMPKQPTTPGNPYGLMATPAVVAKTTLRQFVDAAPDSTPITYQAAAAYIAGKVHDEAVKQPDPAKTLDGIADALPDTMSRVFTSMGTDPGFQEVMRPALADYIWAYGVVEQARTTWDPGYRYALDILVDGLKKGSDPASVRADVHRIAGQLAAMKAGR
ncbi:MAG TPA: hypothetical protein VI172_15240 [Candidatus Dormibacteraeota bacterium]|jgi:ABC-type branched-subunit amino acid transport system substrate-binding protein